MHPKNNPPAKQLAVEEASSSSSGGISAHYHQDHQQQDRDPNYLALQSQSQDYRPAHHSGQSSIVGSTQDVNMPLTGTGAEQASGGASSEGTMEYEIPRAMSVFGDTVSTYTKLHKFMTFGLASNVLTPSVTPAAPNARWLTTYLAEIPWHLPVFYMNISEFNLLPAGTRCTGVSIKITYRGSTIQFQTAATSSGLATLNQINDIAVASALNKTGWGSNVSFSAFDTTQPMLPTEVAKPKYGPVTNDYRGMANDYYGTANNDANFGSYIPHHQLGRQTFLYNYFALSTKANTGATVASSGYGGWPCIASKLEQLDGKTVVNTQVMAMEYSPKMGMLKPPLKENMFGLPFPDMSAGAPGNIGIQVGGNLPVGRQATLSRELLANNSQADGAQMNIAEALQPYNNQGAAAALWTQYTPIEKSQISRSGAWGAQDPHVQPSCHIGVQPVPALSTAALLTENAVFNNWTDTRAYWEVEATMTVKSYLPTAFPYAAAANIPSGDVIYTVPLVQCPPFNVNPMDEGPTYAGLHTQAIPQLPQPS